MDLIPLLKPLLPDHKALEPYLKRISQNRLYSNFGPLVQEFHKRVEDHVYAPRGSILSVTNGTLGLMLSLLALLEEKPISEITRTPICLLPAWTFAASAAAVVGAGLQPYFLDIDSSSWSITPDIVDQALAELPDNYEARAVMVVAPYGAPWEPDQWDHWSEKTGIPVLIDAAAGFDSLRISRVPVMVSLHATKVFGIGEGGIVGSRDLRFMERLKRWLMFGFQEERKALVPGINAKISEYTAAIGLAAFDQWSQRRQMFLKAAQSFRMNLAYHCSERIKLQPEWGLRWISSTFNIFTPAMEAVVLQEKLQKAGIQCRPWWSGPLTDHTAYQGYPRSRLENTEAIAPFVLGLPFFADLSPVQIEKVCQEVIEAVEAL